MRYLAMIRIDENTGQEPSERLLAEMGQLVRELTESGAMLDGAGLQPTAQGKRVRWKKGRLSTIDGPFTETKEVIGGYAMLKADSMDEALALAKRFVEVHGDEWDLECEVRQLEEPDSGER